MAFALAAVVIGIVLGLATGGRPSNARDRAVRDLPVLVLAVGLQLVPAVAALVASYVLLVAFAVRNLRLVGMPVVLVGLVLNLVVIAVNGGMPVRAEAIRAVDHDAVIDDLDFGAKRHLEDGDDRLTFLGDIVPLRPARQIVSFGDLVIGVGLANVVFRLLRPAMSPGAAA